MWLNLYPFDIHHALTLAVNLLLFIYTGLKGTQINKKAVGAGGTFFQLDGAPTHCRLNLALSHSNLKSLTWGALVNISKYILYNHNVLYCITTMYYSIV